MAKRSCSMADNNNNNKHLVGCLHNYNFEWTTYMKLSVSITLHPSYDNIRLRHLSIWREAKTNPASGADIHCKANSLLFQVKVPVQCVTIVQIGSESILFLQVVGTCSQLHKCSEQDQHVCCSWSSNIWLHIIPSICTDVTDGDFVALTEFMPNLS